MQHLYIERVQANLTWSFAEIAGMHEGAFSPRARVRLIVAPFAPFESARVKSLTASSSGLGVVDTEWKIPVGAHAIVCTSPMWPWSKKDKPQ